LLEEIRRLVQVPMQVLGDVIQFLAAHFTQIAEPLLALFQAFLERRDCAIFRVFPDCLERFHQALIGGFLIRFFLRHETSFHDDLVHMISRRGRGNKTRGASR
jgi:hypothetical protein